MAMHGGGFAITISLILFHGHFISILELVVVVQVSDIHFRPLVLVLQGYLS